MTTSDTLKKSLSVWTSLALPSVNQYGTGQQRVLEQVQALKRTKKSTRSGSASALSPTSPTDSVFIDPLKSAASAFNGGAFGNGLSKTLNHERNWHMVKNFTGSSAAQRNTLGSQYERCFAPVGSMRFGKANTSRSESDVGRRVSTSKWSVAAAQRQMSNRSSTYQSERIASQFLSRQSKSNNQFIASQLGMYKAPSKHSIVECAPKKKGYSGSNVDSGIADITMKEAVEYLSSEDEAYQYCGASFIQHNTFIEDKAKQEVFKFNGIPRLVALLRSPSTQVCQTASAALRNLSFKSSNNKEEVQRCDGITEASALLRDTDSVEIQRQLTGLLWNLSSVDNLKPDLLKSALPALMERVILPYTTGPDRTISSNLDPEVFFNVTGCLRNLSSAKQSNRQAMRKCRGLVDSLASYVQDCVEAGRPDDKSVENCVCILHNLTFQLEAEAPALFSRITALAKTPSRTPSQADTGPIGCFSPQSRKVLEHERHFDFPVVEDQHPSGAGWLIHSQTLQSYLSLLESSQREETQVACCGALQNLTTHQTIVSSVMSQTIVQKLNGLQVITPLLKSPNPNLQKNAVALVGNLAKNPHLQTGIARKALPELVGILTSTTMEGNESDDTVAMACHTAHSLVIKEPDLGKLLLSNNLIKSLNDLSQNRDLPKSSKAASLFLYNLWSDKEMHSLLKKRGMNKAAFVNDVTVAAHKSVQVVE
ncbi:plakophilin-1-like [Diretmus argenteus]